MSTNNTCPAFGERHCSRLPVKIPHTKCKEGRKHQYFYKETYDSGEEAPENIECYGTCCDTKPKSGFTDRSTQMSLKTFYDSYMLDGLLNTETKRNYSNLTNDLTDTTDDVDSLADIRSILLKTNDKLDMILSALAEKKEQFLSGLCRESGMRHKRRKVSRHRTKSESFKSTSNMSLTTARRDVNIGDFPPPPCPWTRCLSSTCISKLRPNPYLISPYFPPYYVRPVSHYNYFKIFGPKYSEPDMCNNLWSPFMFLATSYNVKKLQNGINNGNTLRPIENSDGSCLCLDETISEHMEGSEDGNEGYTTCREERKECFSDLELNGMEQNK